MKITGKQLVGLFEYKIKNVQFKVYA